MINPVEPLTEAEETALAKRIQRYRREEDVIKLAMSVLKECVAYTMTCSKQKLSEGELISLCYEKLMKTARRFKPGEIRFMQFAKIGLRGSVYDHFTSLKTVRNAKEIVSVDTMNPPWMDNHSHDGDDPADHVELREVRTREIVEPDFETIYTRDRWESIKPILDKVLTAHERMILDLSFIQGLNCRQIGNLFDLSRQSIQLQRAQILRTVRCELLRLGRLYNSN